MKRELESFLKHKNLTELLYWVAFNCENSTLSENAMLMLGFGDSEEKKKSEFSFQNGSWQDYSNID